MACHKRSHRPRAHGVTLIELMIAVSVVGVLAAMAYPSYQRYVARAHRNAAAACLSQYAQFMERFYTTHLTYRSAVPSASCRLENDMEQRYRFEVAIPNHGRSYTVQAIPINTQAALDGLCGTLSVDQAGRRGPDRGGCW